MKVTKYTKQTEGEKTSQEAQTENPNKWGPTADNSTGALPVVPALPSTGPPPAEPQPNPVEGAGTGPKKRWKTAPQM